MKYILIGVEDDKLGEWTGMLISGAHNEGLGSPLVMASGDADDIKRILGVTNDPLSAISGLLNEFFPKR